jgi:rubrerythrin
METVKNLTKAFIGESQARNRYTFYAKIAKKEGFEQIAEIFLITADNEGEHAKWLYRMINQISEDKEINVEAAAPITLKDTKENLKAAIAGENYEYTTMYPEFADVAEKEGFKDIAARLRAIAKAKTSRGEIQETFRRGRKQHSVQKREKSLLGLQKMWLCTFWRRAA